MRTSPHRTSPLLYVLVLLSLLSLIVAVASAASASAASVVVNNPYVSGCLYHHNLTTQIRVCNSDDSANTIAAGLCRQPPVPQYHHPEIRLLVQDWETAAFENWIIQFILSELLDVPTSAESGTASTQMNFYNPQNKFEVGLVMPMYKVALGNAYRFKGDCAKARASNSDHGSDDDDDEHVMCAHFVAETWHSKYIMDMVNNGTIESPQGLGALAQEGWFVPRFTAEKDPTLLSYIGLGGEENRKKLAARFKRPTTWKDYCDQVSLNNCTVSDTVAKRAPQNDEENVRMFVDGIFTGYFRFTDKNDCELNPTNCTGHFMDYPCSWRSSAVTQAYYLNISVDGDGPEKHYLHGYPVSQIEEIYRAANATRSDVIMFWYTPSVLSGDFLGSDFELTSVSMPTATQDCVEHRVPSDERCSDDPTLQVGDERGACQDPPNSLQSIIVSNLFHSIRDPSIAEEVRSPAYDMLKRFRITELQLVEIFTKLHETNEPRRAVCDWAAENIEYLQSFIPASYPRHFEEQEPNASLMYAASIFGGIVAICVMVTAALVYRQRSCRLIRRLQVDFFWLSLGGLFLVATGAVVMAPPQSNGTCIATIWLVNLGYTILLVPLMVKIDAINSVNRAATRFRHKTISRAVLFRHCSLITSLVVIFLILWTSIDTPGIESEYQMVDFDNGVVAVSAYCSSQSSAWKYVSVGWIGLLLFGTSVLAFQMRKVRMEEFCETPTLCLMVYSHLFFNLCRLTTYCLHSHVSEYVLSRAESLILSTDSFAALMIYFVPKIVLSFYPDRLGSSLPRSSMTFTSGPPNIQDTSTDFSSAQSRMKKEHEEVVALLKEEIGMLKEELKNLQGAESDRQQSPNISSSSSSQVAPPAT